MFGGFCSSVFLGLRNLGLSRTFGDVEEFGLGLVSA